MSAVAGRWLRVLTAPVGQQRVSRLICQEERRQDPQSNSGIKTAQRKVQRTLDEVDEHLQVPDLRLELLHQLLFDPGGVDDLSDGGVHSLPQLLGGQVPDVLVQVHVQLLDQLVNDDLTTGPESGGYHMISAGTVSPGNATAQQRPHQANYITKVLSASQLLFAVKLSFSP